MIQTNSFRSSKFTVRLSSILIHEDFPFWNFRRKLLATGDAEGRIRIWQLSDNLTNQDPQEIDHLEEIAGSALE